MNDGERKRLDEAFESELTEYFGDVMADVMLERARQGLLHTGRTCRHVKDKYYRLAITAEEFGEIAKAMMESNPREVYDETIQTIACLVASLEGMIERNEVTFDR